MANQNHAKEKNKLLADNAKVEESNKELRKLNSELREQIESYIGEDFQSPQGKVANVGSREVWINLGKRDGLRTGVASLSLILIK